MFRSLTLFCFVTVLVCSYVCAQEAPVEKQEPIKTTPEILSLFDESLQSLASAEPNARAGGLFQLLDFGIHFDDKAPVQKIVDTLLVLAPSIEPVELRNQLYEGVANAFCDMENYSEAVGVLNRIILPADRYERQLSLAIKIIFEQEEDKTLKPFDTSDLLRQAIAGASGAQDNLSEAMTRGFLGRELARQGKKEEARSAFAEAMSIAQQIKETRERWQIVQLVFESQVKYDQVAEALITLPTIADPESKQFATYTLIQNFIRFGKTDEAEKLLQTIPAGEMRDSFLQDLVAANLKTLTDEKVGELAALVSSDELRERFLQRLVAELQKNDREDVAVLVGKRVKESTTVALALLVGKVEVLVGKKQFAEAVQLTDKYEDETIRQHLKRQILTVQFQETHDESVAQQIAETFTSAEKISLEELSTTAGQAIQIANPAEQMDVFLDVLQGQFRLMDLAGARKTMKLVSDQLDKETDPVRLIQGRLLLARLQVEMWENQKATDNLGKLMLTLSAVKDLKVLKDLVPAEPQQPESAPTPAATEGGVFKLDIPGMSSAPTVDESAIRDQLFHVYLMSASLLAQAKAPTESKGAFEKAKELATTEPITTQKGEKLLILAQFLAEGN